MAGIFEEGATRSCAHLSLYRRTGPYGASARHGLIRALLRRRLPEHVYQTGHSSANRAAHQYHQEKAAP